MTATRRAAALGLICLSLALVFAASAQASPISQKKAKLQAVQARLDTVYAQSDVAVEKYNEATSLLKSVRERIVRNQHLLTAAEAKLQVADDTLSTRARQIYKSDDSTIVDVVLASHTFEDFVTQLDIMKRLTDSDADVVRAATAYRQEVVDRRVALQADQKSALKLVAQRQKSKEQVLALQSQLEGAAGGLKDQIAQLQAKAAAAAKAAAERAAALAAQQAAAQTASTASTGSSGSGGSSGGSTGGGSTGGGSTGGGGTVVDPGGASHSAVVAIAQRYLGVPYVWGGAGPSGFDCSGLTMYCYAQIGIGLAHGATLQQKASKPVPISALQPGDLVFFGNSAFSSHVGIYVGGGQMIDAPHTGAVVRYDDMSSAWIGGRF